MLITINRWGEASVAADVKDANGTIARNDKTNPGANNDGLREEQFDPRMIG